MGWFKDMIMKALKIQPADTKEIVIREPLSFEGNVLKNRMWYRGEPSELEQFFKSIVKQDDNVSKARFWAAVPYRDYVRKFHSGIPAIMVDRLADIVVADVDRITVNDCEPGTGDTKDWEEIADDNNFFELMAQSVTEVLVAGDGSFKITIDTDVSKYPIIEFYSGENVQYITNHGRLQEIDFFTSYTKGHAEYRLKTRYGKGWISYELYDETGKEVQLSALPETAELQPATFSGDFIMAVPLMFFKSARFEGRGKCIYDVKSDNFDALDETLSQWIDAVRAGRVNKYMPKELVPRNEDTGALMTPNPFDNQFIKTRGNMSEKGGGDKIEIVQPDIKYEAFVETYAAMLDICMQGIISPATLGIDLKKTDNSEAQREKEKVTHYTRGKMIDTLSDVIPALIRTTLQARDLLHGKNPGEYDATIEFGEYGSPTFEQTVDTVGKSAQSGIMSTETQVDQLWGDRKDDDWKREEVARIKAERGIVELEEPAVAMAAGVFKTKLEDEENGGKGSGERVPNESGRVPGASGDGESAS